MATIVDVAKEAGVSIKTVSRVMNNHSYVRKDTKERVQRAMKALDYSPSEAAQRMRTGKSRLIGMLYGDPSSGYQSRLNHAMLQACSEAGTYLAAGIFDEAGRGWKEQLEAFLDRTKADKMVLVPPMCDSTILHEVLIERGVRFVLLSPSRSTAKASAVAMDDQLAAREITQHLLDLGHKRIAHISGDSRHVASLLRRQGYEEAVLAAVLPRPSEDLVVEGRFDFRTALSAAEKILSQPDRPTAIFAASDDMAAAASIAASKLGLNVPGDISVAGFDNAPISQTIWPALTTVAQPFAAMASEVVRLLNRSSEPGAGGDEIKLTIVPHRLIIRESCAAARLQ